MQPIYINVGTQSDLLVLPNTQAHLDGHPVITYSYHLYRNVTDEESAKIKAKESGLLLKSKADPDCLGEIIFELPGGIYNYVAGPTAHLTMSEVRQAAEQISHYRDHPANWKT